jgi:hypothetical protein
MDGLDIVLLTVARNQPVSSTCTGGRTKTHMEVFQMLRRNVLVSSVVVALLAIAIPAAAVSLSTPAFSPVPTSPFVLVYQDSDWLSGPGDSWTYRGTLSRGVMYKFQLTVPWNTDFDIKIYDGNGNLVAIGAKTLGADETVYVTPAWTGSFRIVVYSYSGHGFYTLKMLRRL